MILILKIVVYELELIELEFKLRMRKASLLENAYFWQEILPQR